MLCDRKIVSDESAENMNQDQFNKEILLSLSHLSRSVLTLYTNLNVTPEQSAEFQKHFDEYVQHITKAVHLGADQDDGR